MATLVSPSGTIGTTTPTYTWTAVPGMTWYYLWVEDTTGTKVQTWMTASTAGLRERHRAPAATPRAPPSPPARPPGGSRSGARRGTGRGVTGWPSRWGRRDRGR